MGATGFYGMGVSKKFAPNIYVGLSTGFVTFFFSLLLVCGSYRSRCYLLTYNFVMILLCLAETIFVSMYFIKNTADIIKNILDFPENYYTFIEENSSLILIVGGCIVGVQFLAVIMAGIHASELKKTPNDTPLLPVSEAQEPRLTYAERAREKYNLDKYKD